MKYYSIAQHKGYFDKGYSLTSYLKYVYLAVGFTTTDTRLILVIGLCFIPFCYLLGLWAYKSGWVEAEVELGNKHNKFVKEIRASGAIEKFK